MTWGAQRERKHFSPPSHPLQTQNKSTPLVFWLWERHTAWIINKGQTITINCLSESRYLSVAGIKQSCARFSRKQYSLLSQTYITFSLRILSRSSHLLYFVFPTSDDFILSHQRCWISIISVCVKDHQDKHVVRDYFVLHFQRKGISLLRLAFPHWD